MQLLSFDTHIFKEGNVYVAYAPALDVSSCGDTDEEARHNIREAVAGFVKTAGELGTLGEILEEAGYRREGDKWLAPDFVSLDRFTMNVA